MHDTKLRLTPDVTDADGLSLARSHQRMEDRWRLRSQVARMGDRRAFKLGGWDRGPFARQAGCGRIVTGDHVEIRQRNGRHYVAGISTCGSVWLCAVCEAKIRTRRAVEMRELGAAHVAAGGSIGLLTFTVRHAPGDELAALIDAETEAWKSIQDDDRFRSLRRTRVRGRRGGVRWVENGDEPLIGFGRALETTQGISVDPQSGSWHPHQHVVMFWRDVADHAADVEWMGNAWAERIERRLGVRPGDVGFDYRTIDASNTEYVSKISDEITRADLKGKSRSPWALVEHASNGEMWAIAAWLEYVETMKGRRSLHLSHGLRARYALAPEQTDEELAAADVDGEVVQVLDARTHRNLMRCGWGEYPRLVDLLIGLDLRVAHNPRSDERMASPPELHHRT